MDLSVQDYIDGLLTEEALKKPSDTKKVEELELPDWYDEKLFNKGRRFFWDFCFSFSSSMIMGLVAILAVPSLSKVLINTYRSTTTYTAYKRYISTFLHTISWFQTELKPGTKSWRSLTAVRSRHFRANKAGKLKGFGVVSQRDMALTLFGFIGFTVLQPNEFGIYQLREGDWEAYNHMWRTIGYMIGLEDKYNLCRKTFEETCAACEIIQDRVFTPCLENVPEYYEHMARSLLEGIEKVVPFLNVDATLFYTRYLAKVPGYIYTEEDRINLQRRIEKQLNGQSKDIGVDSTTLMTPCAVDGLPPSPPRLLYYHDYHTLDSSPPYKKLSTYAKFRMNTTIVMQKFYQTYLGRYFFNYFYIVDFQLMSYFPYGAFTSFGLNAFVDMFKEGPVDYTQPKPNSEYYKKAEEISVPWYLSWIPKQYLNYFSYFINYRQHDNK